MQSITNGRPEGAEMADALDGRTRFEIQERTCLAQAEASGNEVPGCTPERGRARRVRPRFMCGR